MSRMIAIVAVTAALSAAGSSGAQDVQSPFLDQLATEYAKVIGGSIYEKVADAYDQNSKYLLMFGYSRSLIGIDIEVVDASLISVGAQCMVDLADLLRITPEGRDGYVTVWCNAGYSIVSVGAGLPIDLGLIRVDFGRVPDPPMAPQIGVLTVVTPVLQIQAVHIDDSGVTTGMESEDITGSISLSLVDAAVPVVAFEIAANTVIDAIAGAIKESRQNALPYLEIPEDLQALVRAANTLDCALPIGEILAFLNRQPIAPNPFCWLNASSIPYYVINELRQANRGPLFRPRTADDGSVEPSVNPVAEDLNGLDVGEQRWLSFSARNVPDGIGGDTSEDAYVTLTFSENIKVVTWTDSERLSFALWGPGKQLATSECIDGQPGTITSRYQVLDAYGMYKVGDAHPFRVLVERTSREAGWILYRATFDDAAPDPGGCPNYVNDPSWDSRQAVDPQGWPALQVSMPGLGDPVVDLSPSVLDFGTMRAGTSDTRSIEITNTGTSRLEWAAEIISGSDWITAAEPVRNSAEPEESGSLTVSLDTTGLEDGITYRGTVQLDTNVGVYDVPVSVNITETPPFVFKGGIAGSVSEEAGDTIHWTSKAEFLHTDDRMYAVFELVDLNLDHDVDLMIRVLSPDKSEYDTRRLDDPVKQDRPSVWWYMPFQISGTALSRQPGTYTVEYWVDDAIVATLPFVVIYAEPFVFSGGLAGSVTEIEPGVISWEPKTEVDIEDEHIYIVFELDALNIDHDLDLMYRIVYSEGSEFASVVVTDRVKPGDMVGSCVWGG
jgi:hypothetical protein